MQSPYLEAGQHHGSPFYEDQMSPQSSYKITSVRIWHGLYVEGIEVFYGFQSMGQRLGTHVGPSTQMAEFVLFPNEELMEVQGKAGAWLDQLTLVTTLNRSQTFGSSTGGSLFTLKYPNSVVHSLKYEVGEYMNSIGAVFGPPKLAPGPMPGPVPMPMPGPMPGPMPEPMPGPMPGPFPEPMPGPLPVGPFQTEQAGCAHTDSKPFDDYIEHIVPMKNVGYVSTIESVTLWYGNGIIEGYECKYHFRRANGETKSVNVKRLGKKKNFFSHYVEIKLEPGEFIVGVQGRSGSLIDKLEFITNRRGVAISAGGNGGGPFVLSIPPGRYVVAFSGATNGHLHNLKAYYA